MRRQTQNVAERATIPTRTRAVSYYLFQVKSDLKNSTAAACLDPLQLKLFQQVLIDTLEQNKSGFFFRAPPILLVSPEKLTMYCNM